MTPNNIIIFLSVLFWLSLFVALHFAWQAEYYKKRVADIAKYVAPQKSGTARKVHRMAQGEV